VTPLRPLAVAGTGETWAKVETGNVSGSHKGRHLMGLAVHLALLEELGWLHGLPGPLAISSCGNAALAAAVVARAAGWDLQVFVPPWAAAAVVDRLGRLGAEVRRCERRAGEAGDPCYLRFREAVADGAIPFATQGNENGLTLEGGACLGLELAEQLPGPVERLYVQVGGGALAASTWLGLRRAQQADRLAALPALHAVQARTVAPLARALAVARELMAGAGGSAQHVLTALAGERHRAMWPWASPGTSAATGILDDETYDWRAVLGAVIDSGGDVVTVDEAQLDAANQLAREATGLDVDHTGTAGLAGLLADRDAGRLPGDSRSAVLLTGARR
jgi:threonine synthase